MSVELSQLTNERFDLLVIGAGINGSGIARDAAMRGLKVLLLDKGDIASGTTSASTRLIHGGLRYLEHGELSLVRESLRERETLLNIAPHLIRPISLLIPMYRNRRRGPFTIRAGMIAYDLLSIDSSLPHHKMLSHGEMLKRVPGLNADGLLGGAIYFDAHIEFPERLVLENVIAAREHGAALVTYAMVTSFGNHNDELSSAQITDSRSRESYSVSARVVVNASGPWVDDVLENTGVESKPLIGGTKGSHIVVGPFRGAPLSALYVEAQSDGRPFFVIPWNGDYLIGTTDVRFDGPLDDLSIEENETEYLLNELNGLIPGANLNNRSVLFSYSGVRPLPFSQRGTEASITRRHFVRQHERFTNLLSVVGGKLTTYRQLAEEAVDLVERSIGIEVHPSTTATTSLPGAATNNFESFAEKFHAISPLSRRTNDRLLRIYGTRVADLLQMRNADPRLEQSIDEKGGAIAAEVVFAFKEELASNLSDCLLRRMMLGLNRSLGLDVIEAVARVTQEHLGWSDDRVTREIREYRDAIQKYQAARP